MGPSPGNTRVDVLVEEMVSGKNRDEHERLRTLMAFTQPGDVIRAKSIDRLARNTRDLLGIVDELLAKGVSVEFVDTPQLSVSTKEGRAMITIFAAFAELERESIRERQLEGIAIAKAAGRYEKAPKLRQDQVAGARLRVAVGVPKARVARDLGVSRQMLYAALNGTWRYGAANPVVDQWSTWNRAYGERLMTELSVASERVR